MSNDTSEADQSRPFTDATLLTFANYIESKISAGGCACFSDIELMDIYKIAPFIYIFDIHADGKWPLRFFGSKLVEAYGRDVTGHDLHDVLKGTNVDKLIEALNLMNSEKKPLWTINTLQTQKHSDYEDVKLISYERVAYPLLGKEGQVDHAISIMQLYDSPTNHPFQSRLFT